MLGLSSVVFIGGQAVDPNSIGELDEKVKAVRAAERQWVTAATPHVTPLQGQPAKRQKAVSAAPDKYQAYLAPAREAARMLKSIYGADGTKFKDEPIVDDLLMPDFP